MSKVTSKVLLAIAVVALTSVGYVSTASARLPSQTSQGHGIKCFFVPVTQPDGSIVHEQVCRKVGV
jgi:hypothetical protein